MRDRRGEHVEIVGDHPHSGQSGKFMGTQPTLVGMAMLIELDNGQSCYVYDSENIKWLVTEL